jgi:TPR repeat protein
MRTHEKSTPQHLNTSTPQHLEQVKQASSTPPIKPTTHLGNSDTQLAIVRNGKPQPNGVTMRRNLLALAIISAPALAQTSDLSYEAYINSNKRIKCLYGYAAEKTRDHQVAIAIFEDCIARWSDIYSMIWLAQMYESGVGGKTNPAKAAELMRLGANLPDGTAYVDLARYHWGVALTEGRGVTADPITGRQWLERAAAAGQAEARAYLDGADKNRR